MAGDSLVNFQIPLHSAGIAHKEAVGCLLGRDLYKTSDPLLAAEAVLCLEDKGVFGGFQGRDGVEGVKLFSAIPVRIRKDTCLYADIGRSDAALFIVRMLAENGLFPAERGIDDVKFYEKGAGLTGGCADTRKGVPPAAIAFPGKRSPQHRRISCQI
jgi:hypothetical protein